MTEINSQIEIWHHDLNFIPENYEKVLNKEEMQKASKYKFDIHRKHFIASRCFQRNILSRYLGLNASDIIFNYTKHGKPYVENTNISFNLSNSGEMASIAISNNIVLGLDIELHKEIDDLNAIAKNFFSSREYAKFFKITPENKVKCFYEIWTRKESFIKAIGEGLSYPLDKFEVSFDNDNPPRIKTINDSAKNASDWHLKSFIFKHNSYLYTGAVTYRNNKQLNLIHNFNSDNLENMFNLN